MSQKGYYLVEPLLMNDIHVNPKTFEFAVAIFYWLIEAVKLDLGEALANCELEVIKVRRFGGKYVAIGVYFENRYPENRFLVRQIAELCDELLSKHSISELLEFFIKNDLDWKNITDKILADK